MSLYAIEKNSSGDVIGCCMWSDDATEIPPGFTACSVADYTTAKNALMNSLQTQAQNAMVQIQSEASLTVAMGETFGTEMKAYVSAVQAIANGTDTTSTKLPVSPESVTS